MLREEADKKISELEGKCQELQSVIQQVSEDFQKVSPEHAIPYYFFAKVIKSFSFINNLSRQKFFDLSEFVNCLFFSHRVWCQR